MARNGVEAINLQKSIYLAIKMSNALWQIYSDKEKKISIWSIFKFQFSFEERFLRDHYNQNALITNEINSYTPKPSEILLKSKSHQVVKSISPVLDPRLASWHTLANRIVSGSQSMPVPSPSLCRIFLCSLTLLELCHSCGNKLRLASWSRKDQPERSWVILGEAILDHVGEAILDQPAQSQLTVDQVMNEQGQLRLSEPGPDPKDEWDDPWTGNKNNCLLFYVIGCVVIS